MKTFKTMAVMAALLFIGANANAQELKTATFLDNYLYGYRLNPSFVPSGTSGFVGIGTGNILLRPETNFGLSSFLFPLADGSLVTGLNSAVPASDFPGGLEEMNTERAILNYNLLSIGALGGKGGYGHFEINLVEDQELGIPRTLFEALKCKNTTGSYNVENLYMKSATYLEIAFGRSKRNRNLSVGWSLKGLVGLASMDASLDMEINTAGNNMWIRSQGTMQAAAAPVSIGLDSDGYYDLKQLGLNTSSLMPAGLGVAVDLGLSYYLWRDRVILSAAVRNLGGMKWTTNIYGQSSGNQIYLNMNDEDKLTEGLKESVKFKPVNGDEGGSFEMLPFSYNVAARIKPVNFITLGVVGTMYNVDGITTKDIRLGAAFTPFRQLNVAGSYSIGEAGNEIGVAASLRILGINVFAGVDAIQYRVTPQYIPLDPVNTTVNAGVAIAFGKSAPASAKDKKAAAKDKKEKKEKKQSSSKKKSK